MTHRTFRSAGWLAVAGLLATALIAPAGVSANGSATLHFGSTHKVTLCHATSSDNHPYQKITVGIATSGHLLGGHDYRHKGPIWSPTLTQHARWGDIIPPYSYKHFSYPGQNWTEAGQAIFRNGCGIPVATEPAQTQGEETATPEGSVVEETATPVEETATPDEETATPDEETATPDEETATPEGTVAEETGTPAGTVDAETGNAEPTPPPTDTLGSTSTPSNDSWRLILVAMAGLLASILVLTPASRTSRR